MNLATFSYNQYNYWNVPLDELPTRGMFYNQNATIKLRNLSVMEVKFLATYHDAISTEICNEIISKCAIFENISLEDLYLPDRMYIIFWIRNNSFANRNGYTINVKSCEKCGNPYDADIKLEDFNITYLNSFKNEIFLPDANVTLPLTIPKFKSSLYKANNSIEKAALYLNTTNTFSENVEFIENLSALDYALLNRTLTENYCGFQDMFEIQCPSCGCVSHIELSVDDKNMFSNVKLFDVLEMITRISKYSGLQITNDWSWIDVEIEQEVINKLIREEEEEGRKEMAKAKSQMHTPSMPHI